MKRAELVIASEAIVERLKLPAGLEIIGAWYNPWIHAVELVVTGDLLPEAGELDKAMKVTLSEGPGGTMVFEDEWWRR